MAADDVSSWPFVSSRADFTVRMRQLLTTRLGSLASSAPRPGPPPQVAAQQRDEFFCDHPVRQILWTLDGGAMQDGAGRRRDHPQRQIHVSDVDVRLLKEPSHRLEYRRVDRHDVSISQRGNLL